MDADTTTARRRGTTLSPAELFFLDQWGRQLKEAFGETPYLVGSVERGEDWRDVDVRMLLPWPEESISPIGVYTLNVALSLWGRHVTGLPIDFQIQGPVAFHGYDGKARNPLGGRAKTAYRGVTDLALGLPSPDRKLEQDMERIRQAENDAHRDADRRIGEGDEPSGSD